MIELKDDEYHCLAKYTKRVMAPARAIVGREKELAQMKAALERPELCNILLLGEAGSGKSACVSALSVEDVERDYLEVDLAKMISNCKTDVNEMAGKLKSLFDDAERFVSVEKRGLVLFMDEFHQIVQLSDAAVEAMKPLLANSGVRNIRVITATTPAEFRKFIAPNQPLVERLQRINLAQTNRETTVAILAGMAERYGVEEYVFHKSLYDLIYECTERYIPANAQPRKSILLLDAMIGWHRATGRQLDKKLLADVIYESEGVNIAFKVDATSIRRKLDERVYAQKYATYAIEKRLQLCVANLNNPTKPMSTFLFSGSTGSGKTEMAKTLAEVLFDDNRSLLRFDMTEYANDNSLDRFRSELAARVWEHPYSIILLDEIEKACSPVTRLLLQVLDDARLIDENNRETSFANAYIIMTTNAGSEIYKTIAQYSSDDEGMGAWVADYDKLIRRSLTRTTGENRFPPELLGRIDVIVPFQPLSEATQKRIVIRHLGELRKKVLSQFSCKLDFSNEVPEYLIKDVLTTDSDSGGARAVISKLESEVSSAVAVFLNANPGCYAALVDIEGQIAAKDKTKRVSTARVVIKPKS